MQLPPGTLLTALRPGHHSHQYLTKELLMKDFELMLPLRHTVLNLKVSFHFTGHMAFTSLCS